MSQEPPPVVAAADHPERTEQAGRVVEARGPSAGPIPPGSPSTGRWPAPRARPFRGPRRAWRPTGPRPGPSSRGGRRGAGAGRSHSRGRPAGRASGSAARRTAGRSPAAGCRPGRRRTRGRRTRSTRSPTGRGRCRAGVASRGSTGVRGQGPGALCTTHPPCYTHLTLDPDPGPLMQTDIRIKDVRLRYEDFRYRTPIKFGGVAARPRHAAQRRGRRGDGRRAAGDRVRVDAARQRLGVPVARA